MFGQRSFSRVVSALFKRHSYEAVIGMFANYVNPINGLFRYTLGIGSYPCIFQIKTPIGIVSPTLYSKHDILTVNEIFCRGDYLADEDIKVTLDLGSNIGLSALYFLSRNHNSVCYAYEPVPENIKRLNNTLKDFENRYKLFDRAVSDEEGHFEFGIESSGRYGGLGKELGGRASEEQPIIKENIVVRCESINNVLANVLSEEKSIDLLKIDIEGAELKTLNSIKKEYLDKIKLIYVESESPPDLQSDDFLIDKFKTVYRIRNKNFL